MGEEDRLKKEASPWEGRIPCMRKEVIKCHFSPKREVSFIDTILLFLYNAIPNLGRSNDTNRESPIIVIFEQYVPLQRGGKREFIKR